MANFNSNSIFPPPKKMNSTCFFIFPPQFLFQGNFPRVGFFPRFLTWKNPGPFSTSPESKVSNASCTTNCLAPLTKVCGWTELIRLDGMDSDAVCVVCVGCVFLFLIIFFLEGRVQGGGITGFYGFQTVPRTKSHNSEQLEMKSSCCLFCFFILKYVVGFIWLRVVQDFNETEMDDGDVEMKSDNSFRAWLVSHQNSFGALANLGFFGG